VSAVESIELPEDVGIENARDLCELYLKDGIRAVMGRTREGDAFFLLEDTTRCDPTFVAWIHSVEEAEALSVFIRDFARSVRVP
jgi:hypothetical protein